MTKISVRPSVIVLQNNKLLVVHSKYNKEEFYLLPGGGIENNETIFRCAIREVKEETNQEVEIIKIVYLNDYITRDGRCINIHLLGRLVGEHELTHGKDPDLSKGKIREATWMSIDKLKNLDFRPKELILRIDKDMPRFNSEDNYFLG